MGESEQAGVIAGRFRLGGLLGSGGTASVFSAEDTVTGRRVAVKLLHPHLSESLEVRAAFLDEAKRIATLSHPCVVTIVDLGTFLDGDTPIAWIAQQLVEGRTLAEHVRVEGVLSPAEVVDVGSDVLSGLAAAHRAELIHRDVSPANVLVRPVDGGLKATLLDFGLADAAGRTAHGDDVLRSSVTTATAGVVGNAHFASPEQLSGSAVGAAGDLYQVGGLLYFALTGRAPFESGDRAAVVRGHLNAPPPVPSVRRRGIPQALDRVVVRALLKDPSLRYTDADEMRRALLAALPPDAPQPAPPPAATARTAATRALAPAPAPVPVPGSPATETPPPVEEQPPRERRAAGWGLVIAIIAVLVATATAVPLLSGAGRTAPPAEAVTPDDAATPSATAATTPGTAAPSASIAAMVVPALTTVADANSTLAATGLRLGDVRTRDDVAPAGTVLESDPAAGTTVARGSTVRLTVASGSNAVPDVIGMDAAAADAHLRAAGFTSTAVTVVSERPAGLVLGSEPAAGSSVALGSAVRVLVAAAPLPSPTVSPPAPTSTPSPSPTATVVPTSSPTPAR